MNTQKEKGAPGRAPMRYNTQPNYSGFLTDEQIVDLGSLKIGLFKIDDLIERVNTLAADTGLPLREIPTYHPKLMSNDISMLFCAHEQALQRIQAAAMERLTA